MARIGYRRMAAGAGARNRGRVRHLVLSRGPRRIDARSHQRAREEKRANQGRNPLRAVRETAFRVLQRNSEIPEGIVMSKPLSLHSCLNVLARADKVIN